MAPRGSCSAADYYPKSLSKGTEFLDAMLAYYERYCGENSTTVFSIGETGCASTRTRAEVLLANGRCRLGWEGDVEERLSWLHQATSKETLEKMPRLKGVSWFNFVSDSALSGPVGRKLTRPCSKRCPVYGDRQRWRKLIRRAGCRAMTSRSSTRSTPRVRAPFSARLFLTDESVPQPRTSFSSGGKTTRMLRQLQCRPRPSRRRL